MDVHTVWLVVFMAMMIPYFSSQQSVPFDLEPRYLKAKEGSCIEIKCKVTRTFNADSAYWFWMKDAVWNTKNFSGSVIYSTDSSKRPVSSDFVNRVKYTGSPFVQTHGKLCGVSICNLKRNDSGQYFFRFVSDKEHTWMTKDTVTLTVEENKCLLTFETPPTVNNSGTITLTCSTSSSCRSSLQIKKGMQLLQAKSSQNQKSEKKNIATVSFEASREDDGKMFQCQTENNEDPNLIRNITVTVEYAPELVQPKVPTLIKEGDFVTLNCTAKGNPRPSFSWFKGNEKLSSEAEWSITSVQDSHSGDYYCEAENTQGTAKSGLIHINVTYAPQVAIQVISPTSSFSEGSEMKLQCNVKRSKPNPGSYAWFKNGKQVSVRSIHAKTLEPEDSGSYTCEATNSAGRGISERLEIKVHYRPRKTNISVHDSLKAGHRVSFICETDAYPLPQTYSWYRFSKSKDTVSLQWTSQTSQGNSLPLQSLERADEACYMCNATNNIATGDNSKPLCIDVLYPPTQTILSMAAEVIEGQMITINCTAESHPPSALNVAMTPLNRHQSLTFPPHGLFLQTVNALYVRFNATWTHTGTYTCSATNSEGSNKSKERQLVVKYTPKEVMVKATPQFVVRENTSLTLYCDFQSYPTVKAVTWRKMTDGKEKTISKMDKLTIESVSPSDRGQYSCAATNEIGTGISDRVMIMVKYAPKRTNITVSVERQEPDGRSSVTLTCSSDCYPQPDKYSWFKKTDRKEDDKVSDAQNITVYSDQPGDYYCIAKNDIALKHSDPVSLFKGDLIKILMLSLLILIILLIIISLALVYRYKRKKTIQRRITSTQPLYAFMDWWNGTIRGNLMNETVLAGPSRSSDDLFADQPCHPKARRHQPPPDNTPASNFTVTRVHGKQAPTTQNPLQQQGGQAADSSLNYASLHFRNTPKNKPVKNKEDTLYAQVSKPKPSKKDKERVDDYENISVAQAQTSSNPLNDDTDSDTSDEEVEVNYTEVTVMAKPGRQRADSDSTSSDDDGTQYSDVKI